MIKNKYFKKLRSAVAFFSVNFRMIVFLCFIFYVTMLGIKIVSAVNSIPSVEDVNKKIQSVSIRIDLVKKIDNFILFRQEEIIDETKIKDPFLPFPKEAEVPPENKPVDVVNVPGVSPAVSPTPAPEFVSRN